MFLPRRQGGTRQDVLLQRRLQMAQRYYRAGQLAQVIDVLETRASDRDKTQLDTRADPMAELLSP